MGKVSSFLGNWVVKTSGVFLWLFGCRPKIYHEDKSVKGTKVKGKAIIMPNHHSVYDVGTMLFTFWRRTPRVLTAELMYKKNAFMSFFLHLIGAIRIERDSYDFSFLGKSRDVLNQGGVIEIYPEARIPLPEEETPLPFKPSVAYLGLMSDAPIIPVCHNGKFFSKERTRVMIGKPIYAADFYDEALSEKENLNKISEILRQKIIELQYELDRKTTAEKSKKA